MKTEYIGSNILELLKKQNKTQVDLANGINSSKQVVNKIIKGKKAIKTSELMIISRYLGVPLDELVKRNELKLECNRDAFNLYGDIKNRKTADFILDLVSNLSEMEEELAAHGLSE